MVLLALLVLLQVGEAPGGEGQPSISIDAKPMQIDGRLPELAFIATTADPIPADLVGIEMLESRTGLIAALEPKAFVSINRLARPADASELDFNSAAMLYLQIQRDQNWHVLAIRAIDDGSLSMVQTDNPQRCWTIRREAFDRLGIPLAASATPEQLGPDREAQTLVLATPHVESEIVLDTRTIRAKIRMTYPRLSRTLGEETIRVRLPKGFDPSTPAGVLVWISPNEDGRIPTIFEPECDELGLIAIGVDNNGNQRQITDRLQNHLDSIETLATRARIDRQRIYLSGMSGGGRCSGILQLAFPEQFAGAVPIVGLDSYHNAPTGTVGQYWPRRLGKPSGIEMRALKDRRIRSITGTVDVNEPEMVLRTKLLKDDGINAEIDVIEGMAHTMPSAEHFSAALNWVDEPRREAIAQARTQARAILDEIEGQDAELPGVRRRLIEVMEMLPYSLQAWEAATRLGYPAQ
jgi:predicted esterase